MAKKKKKPKKDKHPRARIERKPGARKYNTREELAKQFVEDAMDKGMQKFSEENVLSYLHDLAIEELKEPKEKRKGYAEVNAGPRLKKMFVNRVSRVWPTPDHNPRSRDRNVRRNTRKTFASEVVEDQGAYCTLSVYTPTLGPKGHVFQVIQEALKESTENNVAILKATNLRNDWYDLLVEYHIHLVKVYDAVEDVHGVEDTIIKPSLDFGVWTEANEANGT